MEGPGLGLRPRPGLKLGAGVGLGLGEEQQTTGQGRLEHRSKVRRAGAGAELVRPVVTEEARGCMSWSGAAEPPTQNTATAPHPTPPKPRPTRTQQQRGLRARPPSGHRGLSELSGPKALAGPAGEGWAELRGAGRA